MAQEPDTLTIPGTDADIPKKPIIVGAMAVGVLLVGFVIIPAILMALTPHPHGTVYEEPRPSAPDFELLRADGEGTYQLSAHDGKVRVLYFGYTSCPDVCPTTLYDLKNTIKELGEDAEDVEVVFITIDPETDTPQRINEYLSHFDESFIGLYGDPEELAAIREAYEVVVRRSDEGEVAGNYGITHSNSMFVIDREGTLTLRMHHDTDVEYLVRDLTYVLKGRL